MKDAGEQAHALRGAADGIGAVALARLCRAVENAENEAGVALDACARATINAIEQARAA